MLSGCLADAKPMLSQNSIEENSIEENRVEKKSKEEKKPSTNKFVPPTLDEVQDYVTEKGLSVDSKQFYDYFTEGNWVDAKGQKVKNWKQKLLTWNKYQPKSAPKESQPNLWMYWGN